MNSDFSGFAFEWVDREIKIYDLLKELNWEIGMHMSLTWSGCVIWRVCLWKTKQWLYRTFELLLKAKE